METYSQGKVDKFISKANEIVINFNEEIVTRQSDEGEYQEYKYLTAIVCKSDSRGERIEKILKSKYPTYGSELAAVNNGGDEYEDYKNFRDTCKVLADETIAYQTGLSSQVMSGGNDV